MIDFKKVTEGNQVSYLIPVKEINEGMVYLDTTRIVKNAINKDRRNEYQVENGPLFYIEMQRASEYADYLKDCDITTYNYHKFNTRRGYTVFIQNNV